MWVGTSEDLKPTRIKYRVHALKSRSKDLVQAHAAGIFHRFTIFVMIIKVTFIFMAIWLTLLTISSEIG
jgi:hypothetical protein